MPKDATKNVDRYKIRGGQLNEFDFHKNQAELAEQQRMPVSNLIPGTPPEAAKKKAAQATKSTKVTKETSAAESSKASKSTKAAKGSKNATAKKTTNANKAVKGASAKKLAARKAAKK